MTRYREVIASSSASTAAAATGSTTRASARGSGTREHGLAAITPSSTADCIRARSTENTVSVVDGASFPASTATNDFMSARPSDPMRRPPSAG